MTETQKRRSSLFARARDSFFRSKGERGADVDTLRGNSGADFEGEAIVKRGSPSSGFLCIFSSLFQHNKNKKMYILVKGPQIFVFSNKTSSSPQFSIPLKHRSVDVQVQVVELMSGLGDVEYRFKFDLSQNKEVCNQFGRVLREQIAAGDNDEVKEKLGHEPVNKSKSVVYAKTIAEEKESGQPAKPITTTDVLEDYVVQNEQYY